jgi:membrane carboxypeptidase/penicillin-binding protein PbpC
LRVWWTAPQSKTNVIYAPQGKIGSPQEIIAQIGAPITLKIETTGTANQYQWFRNGEAVSSPTALSSYNIPTLSSSLAGTYTVRVRSAVVPNLVLQSYNIILLPDCSKLTAASKPNITVNGSVAFCGTETVNTRLITAENSNIVSYKWYLNGIELNNSDRSSIFAYDAGRYRVQVQTKDGCSLLSDDLAIFLFPEYAVSISKNQETLSATATDKQLVSFEWLLGNTLISGANQQSYIPQQIGSYRVRVTDINGCRAISLPINVSSVTAVEDNIYEGQIGVYPNPSEGIFYVEIGTEKATKIEVCNAIGKYFTQFITTISANKYMIDLKNQANGLFFIQITTQKGKIIRKIVKE